MGKKIDKMSQKTGQKRKIIKKGLYNVIYSHKIIKNTKKMKKIFLGPKKVIFWSKAGQKRKIIKNVLISPVSQLHQGSEKSFKSFKEF